MNENKQSSRNLSWFFLMKISVTMLIAAALLGFFAGHVEPARAQARDLLLDDNGQTTSVHERQNSGDYHPIYSYPSHPDSATTSGVTDPCLLEAAPQPSATTNRPSPTDFIRGKQRTTESTQPPQHNAADTIHGTQHSTESTQPPQHKSVEDWPGYDREKGTAPEPQPELENHER